MIKVEGQRNGTAQRRSSISTINIRVDYQDKSGEYVRSVLYHEGVYTNERSFVLPWGTQRAPDEIVEVASLNDCNLNIAAYQPENFSGRVLISFEMQNVGAGVKQNFQLSRGTSTGVDELPEADERTEDYVSGQPMEVYNLIGQRQTRPRRGINIVRDPEDRAHKICVK